MEAGIGVYMEAPWKRKLLTLRIAAVGGLIKVGLIRNNRHKKEGEISLPSLLLEPCVIPIFFKF